MTRLYFALQLADALTTLLALHCGLDEANPLMQLVIQHDGLGGMLLAKAVLALSAYSLVWSLKQINAGQVARWVLVAVTAITALVVCSNVLQTAMWGA